MKWPLQARQLERPINMNIYEIQEETGIPLRKLNRIYNAGLMRCDPVDPILDGIYFSLSKNASLTVKQLLALIERPKLLHDLARHEEAARVEIYELGDFAAETAPREIVAHIHQAAYNDQFAIAQMIPWLKSVIPTDRAVRHHYLAIRLIMGSLSPVIRQRNLKVIRRTLDYCRMHPDFEGWWKVEQRKGQRITWYSHPPVQYDL